MEKLFIFAILIALFNIKRYFNQWVKEQGDRIFDYDLVEINDHKSHSYLYSFKFGRVRKDVKYRMG